ncbi:histidinol-phosphatase HisJ [Desulfocicer niacini]
MIPKIFNPTLAKIMEIPYHPAWEGRAVLPLYLMMERMSMKMNKYSDYHMHSLFSDGSASIDEMAQNAIKKGLSQITITDHMPLPHATRYAMAYDRLELYRQTIRTAQLRFGSRLKINMGIEMEFIPMFSRWIEDISNMGWDHMIVSVHALFKGNCQAMVNGSAEEFATLVENFNYDVPSLCRSYYETLKQGYRTGLFEIAGHIDVIKKHNVGEIFFRESDAHYRDLVISTLDVIREQGMKMEVNTAGFNHPVARQYPSDWIIQAALEKEIPIVLSSDSHTPDTLGQHFDKFDFLSMVSPVGVYGKSA